jgi:hypothetical protein
MIKETNKVALFSDIGKSNMFVSSKALYTRENTPLWKDNSPEGEKHIYQKIGPNKAITFDKRTVVHFTDGEEVIPCVIENNVAL